MSKFIDTLSEADAAALSRALVTRGKRKGALLKRAPCVRTDPEAWAAWAAVKTASGQHAEGLTGTLIIYPETRDTWDRISDAAIEWRKRAGV